MATVEQHRFTPPAVRTEPASRRHWLARAGSAIFAVAFVSAVSIGVASLGRATDWKMPKASALRGESVPDGACWCEEHGVPESECVECREDLFPRGRTHGWCKVHGVAECPLCHPDVAQLPELPSVLGTDRERAARALAFSQREENDAKCRKHTRRIQLASDDIAMRLGLTFVPVVRGRVRETIRASGEIAYEPSEFARVGPRASGTVWRVESKSGDRVRRGDVLALVESAEVGAAKAEFQSAAVQLDARKATLAKLLPMAESSVSGRTLRAAEAAVEEAEVRTLAAEQMLGNLGMPFRAREVAGMSPADLAGRMQFLGLPAALAKGFSGHTASNNLLPVLSPLDGEVVMHSAVQGEATDPARPLFSVANTGRMLLTLAVRLEDADRIERGQVVRFRHPGHVGPEAWDSGTVTWVSPATDEKTRTVPVRAVLANPSDRHRSNTFGTAEVLLREEPEAIVVPSAAIHWEGCCHIAFVRDKNYGRPGAPRVIHVRKVRLGAKGVPSPDGPVTEIIAGLLPGESIAVAGSGFLRSELLKNDLGEGCACCAGK